MSTTSALKNALTWWFARPNGLIGYNTGSSASSSVISLGKAWGGGTVQGAKAKAKLSFLRNHSTGSTRESTLGLRAGRTSRGGYHSDLLTPGDASRIIRSCSCSTSASASASTNTSGGGGAKVSASIPEPEWKQLSAHALRCGIPMVGFGIIDNLVMITAGEHIQCTIGITLGLTTMAAAGLGQVVSDISGIMSGGTVDALVGRLLPNLPRSGLTSLQKELTSARMAQTAGGCIGVTIGCLLGMSVLFFMDAEAIEKQKTAAELERIFDLVERSAMNTVDKVLGAEMSILWMIDKDHDNAIWTRVVADGDIPTDQEIKKTDFVSAVRRTDSSTNIVMKTIQTGKVQKVSLKNEGPLKNMMTAPIIGNNNQILGAIQIVNKFLFWINLIVGNA